MHVEFYRTWSECGFIDFTNLINILVSEIARSPDAQKDISKILAMFSEINASPFVRVTEAIEDLLNSADLYGIRNDALTIFGQIAIHLSTNEREALCQELEMEYEEILQVVDLCCEACFRHLRDVSSFCRTKALDVLEKLASKGKMKLEVISEAIKGANRKLLDESIMVRKKALRLVDVLIRNNPVGDMFGTSEQFEEKIQQTRAELKQRQQECIQDTGSYV